MKKILNIILVCFLVFGSISIVACEDKDKLVTAPSQQYIMDCLENVPGIIDIEAVTEQNDPNNLINKDGSYYAAIYFSYSIINQDNFGEDSIIEVGTQAGGCIEVFQTKEDANKRNNYLASFDGTFLATGSHQVVGTLVIRVSNLLRSTQQTLLENNIIAAFKGNDSDINTDIGMTNNEYYDSCINFPARTIEGYCSESVLYLVWYESENNYAVYADVDIEYFDYNFNDTINSKLEIEFSFECYIRDMYENTSYFGFDIVAKDGNNNIIATSSVFEQGELEDTISIECSLLLNMTDVVEGVTIEFDDYKVEY